MKKVILILAVVGMTTLTHAAKTFSSAVEYNNFLVGEYDLCFEAYVQFKNVVKDPYGTNSAIEEQHDAFIQQCELSLEEIKTATVFSNGDAFRDICLQTVEQYLSFADDEMAEIVSLATNEELTENDIQTIEGMLNDFELLDVFYLIYFQSEQEAYANANGFSLK